MRGTRAAYRDTLAAMRRVAVILLSIAGCGRIGFDTTRACPSSYVALDTGCYRIVTDAAELEWLAAEQACEGDGGHLAVVDDDDERTVLVNATVGIDDFWIGASDRVTPDSYISVTGAPFFLEWRPNEPNMTGDCLEIELGAMGDSECDFTNDYVCEIDGIDADPTTY
jgi:hypothetical protein